MANSQQFKQVVSADSHVMEPPDLWWNALGDELGDRTPRSLDEYQGKKGNFYYSGYKDWPVWESYEDSPDTEAAAMEAVEKGFGDGGWDPAVRVQFQMEAGLQAEVMNPTTMLGVLKNPDTEVVQRCSEVYNDWVAEFASHAPDRLIPISVIPMYDVDWAVKELERTLKKGLVGPMINCQAPDDRPHYRNSIYDPFWAAANEAKAPVTLHLLTGRKLDPLVIANIQTQEERTENPSLWIEMFNEIQLTLADDFIFGGILDRFPGLKVVSSEFELSWVPGFMARLDQIEDIGPRLFLGQTEMKASDYMRTKVFHGFIDDTVAEHAIPQIGASQVMWGSDFPHIRSIGLEARSALQDMVGFLPEDDQNMVVGENALEVFKNS